MACGSGCCGQTPTAALEKAQTLSPQTSDNNDENIPSPGRAIPPIKDSSNGKAPQTNPAPCQDACCGEPSEEHHDDTKSPNLDTDCCAPAPVETACNKGCCSSTPKPELPRLDGCDEKSPVCCEDGSIERCDESCLDRVALRECSTSSHTSSEYAPSENEKKPCAEHVRKTRKTYASQLEAIGCICRALVALGQESCCSPQRRPSASSSKMALLRSRASMDSCCATTGTDAGGCSKKRPGAKKVPRRGGVGSSCRPASVAGSCADSCCGEKPAPHSARDQMALTNPNQATDPEKGFSITEKNRVILSISGMTCTGCETKLIRTLSAHPAIRNLKTSLVLSRAEFDLVSPSPATAAEVMAHLERTTEFKCERITNRGVSLDLIAPGGDAARFTEQPWPHGVTDMRPVDKETVNVSFDAKIVGARDLAERGWDSGPVHLAPPRPDPTLEAGNKHVRHLGYMTLLSAVLTIPVLVMAWAPLVEHDLEYGSASLALATLVQVVIAGPFYPKAIKAMVFSRVVEMDLLVVLSTSAAYIFSVISFGYLVSGYPLSTGEFFETSTLLVTLIMVGRWVSALARQKAVESISIRSLQTSAASLVTEDGEVEIDARLLQYGDVFKVVPDSRIPTDGTVVYGSSEVDEAMITGESIPVVKQVKSSVIAGSVNGSGILHVRLTRVPGDNTISDIAGMVDEAKLSKPKVQDIADRISSYFVPVVITLTLITFSVWIAIGIHVRGQSASEAAIQAIMYAITVLIVSCPCAIGLAVPMVIVVASGVAAERGVIFKTAEGLEMAYKTAHVVFDKTGTITEGKLTVAREWYSGSDQGQTLSLLLGLVGSIKHPVSVAVARHLTSQGVLASQVSDLKSLTGKGVEGYANSSGLALQAGNSRWLNLSSDPVVQSVLSEGYTAFCFTINGSVAAIFGLEDSIRPDAASTVKTLLERGISVHIISGDDDGAVRAVAAQLSITNIRSRCTPADKQVYIQQLLTGYTSSPSKKKPVVIFCGDGTNDAVALAQATIGVHMNEGGTDVSKSAADVVLMRPNLAGILTIINVSKRAMARVAFNFGWSFVYNLFAILLAAGAFVNASIPPQYAGLGELVSVLPVIAAAVALRWERI
ncbi:E1-E2 ATPase-domain-containing protein [Bombardia bombarda]|uniref:E1-E2 ATPase-domain-containing protein n=1 Tax=Bombardia bombarda TaxID=252184 RepID=A0AA39X0V5_9PEZI|nr:E1-E2 ATPase-domain-containing protein [Bombardia bombarda]